MGVTLVRMNQELLGPRLSSTMKMRMKRILWVLEPSLILGVKFFAPGDDDDDDDSSDDENEDDQFMDGNSSDDDATVPEDEDDDQEHDDVKNFRREVMDSVNRGLDQGVAPDNLVLEINGSKHAWNITLSEVNQCVLYSVLTANITLENATAKAILPSVLKNIKKLSQLLVKYSKSKSGQQYYLEGLEIIVARHEIFLDLLPKIVQTLNQEFEVIEDEKILAWNKKMSAAANQDSLKSKIVGKLKPFIEWLEQSDSEEKLDKKKQCYKLFFQ